MKIKVLFVILVFVFFSCEKLGIGKSHGKLISHSSCKNETAKDESTSESCAEYSYDSGSKILTIAHINTSFNCCPDKLYSDIKVENDTIFIEESEKESGCSCMCLFDINVEIYDIEAKSYFIKFIEPYAGNQEKLIFEIDLSVVTSGSYCVERENYPWRVKN